MPVYQINRQYIDIDSDPIKLAVFMNKTNNATGQIGHFESYMEDYEKVRDLLNTKYGANKPVGGFVDHLATIKNQHGEQVSQMIVVAAFEDTPGNPRFLAEGDWVIGKCPPNDRPQREDGANAPAAQMLASMEEALNHLRIN